VPLGIVEVRASFGQRQGTCFHSQGKEGLFSSENRKRDFFFRVAEKACRLLRGVELGSNSLTREYSSAGRLSSSLEKREGCAGEEEGFLCTQKLSSPGSGGTRKKNALMRAFRCRVYVLRGERLSRSDCEIFWWPLKTTKGCLHRGKKTLSSNVMA